MKTLIMPVLAASLLAMGPPALSATPTPAPAPAEAATATTNKALSAETSPIETIAANPDGKAALEKHIPGITTHEAYDNFKTMTLRELQPLSNGIITDEAIKAIQTDLDRIGT